MVECVQEVASELQPHSLGDWEVLLQTQIHIGVARPDYRSLCRTSPKWAGGSGITIWSGVEPSITSKITTARIKVLLPSKRSASSRAAIGAQSPATRVSGIA